MKKHVKIFTGDSILVNRLSFLLNEKGIASFVKDNTQSARIAGFGSVTNNVILYVFQSDFEESEKIIKEYLENNK